MFTDPLLAARIDAGEARLSMSIARTLTMRGVNALVTPIAGGVSVLAQAGSPLNKIIGIGYQGLPDDETLAEIERVWWARGVAVRFEVATLADPGFHIYLTERGYRLHGFEHVLTQPIDAGRVRPVSEIVVERVRPETLGRWLAASLAGWSNPDGSGVFREPREDDGLAEIFRDFAHTEGLINYLAYLDGVVAGSAGARFDDDHLAYFVGASTVPTYRRRGVQAAVLGARLVEAADAGCELAVVTTAPGSQSQANVMRGGFALAYARAVLVRPPPA